MESDDIKSNVMKKERKLNARMGKEGHEKKGGGKEVKSMDGN